MALEDIATGVAGVGGGVGGLAGLVALWRSISGAAAAKAHRAGADENKLDTLVRTVTDLKAGQDTAADEAKAAHEGIGTKIEGVQTELTGKIEGVQTELTGKIEGVQTELTGKIEGVRTDLNSLAREVSSIDATVKGIEKDLSAKR